jgi:hypothetical protein
MCHGPSLRPVHGGCAVGARWLAQRRMALGWLWGLFLATKGPTGRGGRVDAHHGDGWQWGGAVWPDGDERQRPPIVLDRRSAGARRERAWDAIGCGGGRGCPWVCFIGPGQRAEASGKEKR